MLQEKPVKAIKSEKKKVSPTHPSPSSGDPCPTTSTECYLRPLSSFTQCWLVERNKVNRERMWGRRFWSRGGSDPKTASESEGSEERTPWHPLLHREKFCSHHWALTAPHSNPCSRLKFLEAGSWLSGWRAFHTRMRTRGQVHSTHLNAVCAPSNLSMREVEVRVLKQAS